MHFCTQVAERRQVQPADGLTRGVDGSEVAREDPRVTSVLERLSQLEGRVGTQLDQLVELQQQHVSVTLHPMGSKSVLHLLLVYTLCSNTTTRCHLHSAQHMHAELHAT